MSRSASGPDPRLLPARQTCLPHFTRAFAVFACIAAGCGQLRDAPQTIEADRAKDKNQRLKDTGQSDDKTKMLEAAHLRQAVRFWCDLAPGRALLSHLAGLRRVSNAACPRGAHLVCFDPEVEKGASCRRSSRRFDYSHLRRTHFFTETERLWPQRHEANRMDSGRPPRAPFRPRPDTGNRTPGDLSPRISNRS